MSDDPHPCRRETKNFNVCKLIFKTLLLTATTAAFAQEQKPVQDFTDIRSDRLTLDIGAENIAALTLQEDKTVFYNDLRPNLTARVENARGDYAQLKAMEVLILQEQNFSSITSKFMLEIGRMLNNGGVIIIKAGREKTEGGALFDHALEYYADSRDAYQFANSVQRAVICYQKNNQFIELGIVGNNADGFYFIPNPNNADFWCKSGLTLCAKEKLKLTANCAIRYSKKNKMLLSSIGISERSGFGAELLGNYDFAEHKGNLGIRTWKDFKRGWQLITETVFNQNRDLYLRGGAGKSGMQFSVEYGKPKNKPAHFNLTVASRLKYSHKIGVRKL